MTARRGRLHVRRVGKTAVDLAEKIRALEPPVTEQLGVEWRDHDVARLPVLADFLRIGQRDTAEQLHEVGCVVGRTPARGGWVIRLLVAEVDVVARDAPQLEAARPPNLMEFQVGAVPGVSSVATPHLERGYGIAHERSHRGRTAAT